MQICRFSKFCCWTGESQKMALWIFLVLSIFLTCCRAVDMSTCHQRTLQRELYKSLHRVIAENAVCFSERDTTTVELLALGQPLAYENFNPGKPSRFEQPGTLPTRVLENGLPYVDKIYPTGSYRFRLFSNLSTTPKDYLFDSFSSTYDYVLTHMMLLPKNFSDQDVLRAKYYLQELVPNPELVLRNETELPRFMLYDYYRSDYLAKKGKKDDAIETNRTYLRQQKYEFWGKKQLPVLESDTEAAYFKWQAFGYKSEVEKQLQYFDIDTHEDKLMSKRALFQSMGRPSDRNAHVTVYPFKLHPADWYKRLKADLEESSDELRYKQSLLQAKKALLNATNVELSSKTSTDVKNILKEIQKSRDRLGELINNGIESLLQMEVECFTRVNLSLCEVIMEGHVAFKSLLQDLAEHFAQAEYLESILNGRPQLLKVIRQKIQQVETELKALEVKISNAENAEASENIDMSTKIDIETVSCPAVGQIKFAFESDDFDTIEYCQESSEPESETCVDVEVPINATKRYLWSVESCFVDKDLETYGTYSGFIKLMNSIPMKISASLLKVDVHRSWFDYTLFEDTDHYTMKRDSGVVAPGPLTPSAYFQRVAHSGHYLLPHYVSSFIVATNISFYFPGLGSWNYSKYDNDTNEVINILMRYAYAPVLKGGIGPFSFEMFTGNDHNYQLKRKNGGLLLTLPGGQIVGYILKTVPKFPVNQSLSSLNVTECDESLLNAPSTPTRRKRSALDSDSPGYNPSYHIKKLAENLFSEGLTPPLPSDQLELIQNKEVMTSDRIEQLIKSGDTKQEKLAKFVQSLEKENQGGHVNSSTEKFSF